MSLPDQRRALEIPITSHSSDMYCEYVIRNNAKSRIQNEWKGPL